MTTTPTTIAETFQRQLPLALQALGLHMEAHHLPTFWSIDVRDNQVFVHLRRGAHKPWTESVVIDAERNEERHPGGVEAIRTEWDVRLPETGFRFTLVSYQAQPMRMPLQQVSA